MPFVAVIGGLWNIDAPKAEEAKAVAKQIGAELANAGFGLVVYFSNDESLEPHVVSGYVEAIKSGSGAIRVRYAESQRGQVKFAEESLRREIFEPRLFPGQDWEAPFYRSIAEDEGVDAVLLLGGATSTFIAGQIALARRLPILAVDAFGGAAAKVWNQLAQAMPNKGHYGWGTRPISAMVEQLREDCNAAALRRREAQRREQALGEEATRRRKAAYAGGMFVVLLLTLFFGFVYTPIPSAYPIIVFLGLVASGATGALVRAILSVSDDDNAGTSVVLGGIAGFVVGLAYLIPQWVGAPGMLEAKVLNVSATDKIQFASAMLVAISAGVGFDTVFNRLKQEAQNATVVPHR